MQNVINMMGKQIGFWTVLCRADDQPKSWGACWVCRCKCGKESIIQGRSLRNGGTHGCQDCANGLRPYEALYNYLLRQAKPRGLEVTISYEDFVKVTQNKDCFYCGSTIVWSDRNRKQAGRQTNLDRRDNTRGYALDNIVVCCADCNRLRGDRWSYDDFSRVVAILMEERLWPSQKERRKHDCDST
jgi:hypothetical protein